MSQSAWSTPLMALVRIGSAAIERVPIHRLPMMRDGARVFADEVGREFLDGRGDGLRAAFDDRFAQPGDAGVGVDFQEQPARLDENGFDLGDLEFVAEADHRLGVLAASKALVLRNLLAENLAPLSVGGARPRRDSNSRRRNSRRADGFREKRATIQSGMMGRWIHELPRWDGRKRSRIVRRVRHIRARQCNFSAGRTYLAWFSRRSG